MGSKLYATCGSSDVRPNLALKVAKDVACSGRCRAGFVRCGQHSIVRLGRPAGLSMQQPALPCTLQQRQVGWKEEKGGSTQPMVVVRNACHPAPHCHQPAGPVKPLCSPNQSICISFLCCSFAYRPLTQDYLYIFMIGPSPGGQKWHTT